MTKYGKIPYIIGLFILLFLAVLNAFVNGSNFADFYPLNGDFQNFNPVRRYFSGQTPFKDFEVYLGLGHLISGRIFTYLFGGDFHASLYAFRALTFLAFEMTVLVIFWAVLRNSRLAFTAVLVFSAFNLIRFESTLPVAIKNLFPEDLLNVFNVTRGPGNSARFIRSCVCVLCPWLAAMLIERAVCASKTRSSVRLTVVLGVIIGSVAALSVFWSNDYGISSAIVIMTISVIVCLYANVKNKRGIKSLAVNFAVMSCSFLIVLLLTAFLITKGHPWSYFGTTMQVSEDQSWYAVHDPKLKAYYLWDVVWWSPYPFVALGLAVLYIIRFLKGKFDPDRIKRYLIPACVLLSSVFAVHLYRFSDGGGTEYFQVIFLSVLLAEAIRAVSQSVSFAGSTEFSRKAKFFSYIIIVSVAISSLGGFIVGRAGKDLGGVYVPGLGGNLLGLGDTVNRTKEKIGSASVFNTYASAVETVTYQFQPSGIDYIIHALGRKQVEKYMDSYRYYSPKYAGIIREDFAKWEGYIRGVNWYFYREMLDERAISFSNAYQNYYIKSRTRQGVAASPQITIKQGRDDQAVITLTFPDETYNGLADVRLDYSIEKTKSGRNLFCFRQIGHVHDSNVPDAVRFFNDIPLPSNADYRYLPVIIKNGKGTVTVSSYPQKYTVLKINSVSCGRIFQNEMDIAPVNRYGAGPNGITLAVYGNRIDGHQQIVKVQHEDQIVSVIDARTDGSLTYLTLDRYNGDDFIRGLDNMSSVKLLNR